jgi:hypothetical protein
VTEWRFGLTIIVRSGGRLFVFDTDGVPFDPKKVGATRLERSDLVRLFAPSKPSHQVRITKLAASSLDMSDRAIRTMTTSTASFEDTFTDLLDAASCRPMSPAMSEAYPDISDLPDRSSPRPQCGGFRSTTT